MSEDDPQGIEEWRALAGASPQRWRELVRERITVCRRATGRAVISRDLSDQVEPGAGPLGGVPYGLKDLFDLRGSPTHASSILPFLLEGAAESDSALVGAADRLGASCAAKTQMNEFAYGLSGENPHYGDCPHPRLPGHISGGSSSGSAYLVGSGALPLAFGTDTGGSIRVPAAYCGIWGLRTVPGYLSRGALPLAESLDTVGWFTRSAEDMRTVLSAWFPTPDAAGRDRFRGSALLPEALLEDGTAEALGRAVSKLGVPLANGDADELAMLLPDLNRAFNILQSGEAYELHAGWLSAHGELYDPAVRQRILRGRDWSAGERAWALERRDQVVRWFADYFAAHDFLILPACPGPAPVSGGVDATVRESTLRLTSPASLAGKPVLAVPVALGDGRSVGLQVIFNTLDPDVMSGITRLCEGL